MSEHEPSQRLKQHFAQRVIHQARQVLEFWQRLQRGDWNSAEMASLAEANLLLMRHAERFGQVEHVELARGIQHCLERAEANNGRLDSALISDLDQLLQRLAHTGLRYGDDEQVFLPSLRKPIYLALQDQECAARLVHQLDFFGLVAQPLSTPEHFHTALRERHPAAIVMDFHFAGPRQGLQLIQQLQQARSDKLPVLFFNPGATDAPTRLAAVRAGGVALLSGNLDASCLLEHIETLTHSTHQEPYRALVIDDSRAQATHTERILNSAGIITRTLNEPIDALEVLAEFQPDLIILDLYMPDCTGPELARLIRQDERYVSVPIIYLSAESDLDKQLDAMNEGGDDFLTKPIQPHHLIATVRNRAQRARTLKAHMVRDSLTGLYNHTHILQLLEDAGVRARRDGRPLTFAMIDIDHFKQVNDQHGHPMGDRVIKSLSLFLKQRLRKTDLIGRYGGEEFAVILPDTSAAAASKVLDSIRQRFAELRHPAQPDDLTCTFSCGIAELSNQDSATLGQQADEALYQAKRCGRNQVRLFSCATLGGIHENVMKMQ